MISGFITFAANSTSSFVIMLPREKVGEMGMSAEEELKMIKSLGLVAQKWFGEEGWGGGCREHA